LPFRRWGPQRNLLELAHFQVRHRKLPGAPGQPARPPDRLTARQREIMQLIAEGKSTKEIAFVLRVSVKTVEAHWAQLMERLGIHEVAGLVRYAMHVGLVPPEAGPEA
jgi:DNA-binding NarL/FixJ family response regulator